MIVGDYPLHWPSTRTRSKVRLKSRSKVTVAAARDALIREIKRWKGLSYVMLSTNLELRKDGLPKAGRAEPGDAGVALYFRLEGLPCVLTSEWYPRVADNLQVIRKCLAAFRELRSAGILTVKEIAAPLYFPPPSQQRQQAPPPPPRPEPKQTASCYVVLGVAPTATETQINAAFRRLSKLRHPDKPGGSTTLMQELNKARAEALRRKGWSQ